MPLCLAAGTVTVVLLSEAFTLAWTHTIEKLRWEEDWRVVGDHLVIEEARIRGAGAGMEPPPGARLADGVWRYPPLLPAVSELLLAHSSPLAPFELCVTTRCRAIDEWHPTLTPPQTLRIFPCAGTHPSTGLPASHSSTGIGRP